MVSALSGDKTGKCLYVWARRSWSSKLEAGRGAGFTAQQIAANDALIYRDSPELSLADLSRID